MKQFLLLAAFCFANILQAQKVTIKDFEKLHGAWKGSLTYLDYTSGKPFTMPANITATVQNRFIILQYDYPQEPKANGNDTININTEANTIDDALVTRKQLNTDGSLQIETEKKGKDGNDHKNAIIKHIYVISDTLFVSRKEVKFTGEKKWIQRNEWRFHR